MGSPPVDGGRHRQLEPDIGAPRTIAFSTSLPDRDIDQPTVRIPAPRAPLDPPTVAIRHVVVPPEPGYDPYWDGEVVQDTRYEQRTPPARGGRWGVALGALVVTGCAAYIAVVGISGLRGGAVAPASTTLTAPQVSATFPASAVPPTTAEGAAPTSRAAVPRRTPVARSAAPVTRTPAAVTAAPTTGPTPGPSAQGRSVQGAGREDSNPQVADPPPEPAAQGSDNSSQPRTAPAPTPPPGAPGSGGAPPS